MENKLDCKCKQYKDPYNNLWYCLVQSHECEKIMKHYHTLCECITSNLVVRFKNGKKMQSIRRSKRKANLGYEYIPSFRPPGGYLRYVLLIKKKNRVYFKECLDECYKARREHHAVCELPRPLSIHDNEIWYIQQAIKMIDVNSRTMKRSILVKLEEEVQDIKNILNDPKIPQKSIKNYKNLLALREKNKDDFKANQLSGWITDDGTEFRLDDL